MRLNAAVAATACLVLFALTGCLATPVAAPTSSPSASPSPEPVASGPLTCDELVPAEVVAAALEGADGVAVEPVAAVKESVAFDQALLTGAGGRACSWRVGAGMPEYNAPSDWAYLTVEVLPDAGAQWVPLAMGDGPSTMTRPIAGIEASVAGGDPGWRLSAPVAGGWVQATLSAAALTSTGGRFAGLGADTMMDRLAQVGETAFPVLQEADASRLTWPAVAVRQGDALCTGDLDATGTPRVRPRRSSRASRMPPHPGPSRRRSPTPPAPSPATSTSTGSRCSRSRPPGASRPSSTAGRRPT